MYPARETVHKTLEDAANWTEGERGMPGAAFHARYMELDRGPARAALR